MLQFDMNENASISPIRPLHPRPNHRKELPFYHREQLQGRLQTQLLRAPPARAARETHGGAKTRVDVELMKLVFDICDVDHSGRLSHDELRQYLLLVGQVYPSEATNSDPVSAGLKSLLPAASLRG